MKTHLATCFDKDDNILSQFRIDGRHKEKGFRDCIEWECPLGTVNAIVTDMRTADTIIFKDIKRKRRKRCLRS
jgi:hypothetical protein